MTLLNCFGVSTLQRRSQRIAHQHLWNTFPRVRIEDLLTQVDAWCDFTRVFRQAGAGERIPRMANFLPTLLATVIAHGTNLGLAMMANRVDEGMTADNLQEMSQWCLREEHHCDISWRLSAVIP